MERPSPFSTQAILLFSFSVHISSCCCCCELFTSPRCPALAPLLHPVSRQNRRLVLLDRDEVLEIVQILHFIPPINSSQRHFKAARVRFWCLAWKSVPVGVSDDVELMPHACFLKQFSTIFRNPVARLCNRKAKIAASVCLACMLSLLFWWL